LKNPILDFLKETHPQILTLIIDFARSMCFIPSFAYVSGVVNNTECGEEMNVGVQRIQWEIRL